MTEKELRELLKKDLEPAFFVGGYGGAAVEMDQIDRMTTEQLVDYAVEHGYATISYDDSNNNQKGR